MSDSRPASSIAAVTFVPRTTSTSAPLGGSPPSSAVVLEVGLVYDLTAGGPQAVEAALLELVGDQHFHDTPSYQMDQQSVAQLRLEPRRLRRHDAAGVGNRHQIVDRHRVHREGDGRRAGVDGAASRPSTPRAPPTKSMRLSLRMSPMPSIARARCRWRSATSRALRASRPPGSHAGDQSRTIGRRGTSRPRPGAGRRRALGDPELRTQRPRNCSRRAPPRSLTIRL